MKKILSFLLCVFLCCSSPSLVGDELDDLSKETDKLWRRGAGAEDGAFTASATSMIGWGLGLAVVAALVTILVHRSDSSTGHSSCVAH